MPGRVEAALTCLLLTCLGSAADAGASDDGWMVLDAVRDRMVADSPLIAGFTQTFTPAGFSTGDVERGTVALDLPECARWDYDEPFPKSFLLCGNVAYAWNPEESSGRRFEIDAKEEEGLDLLRLDVVDLRRRFEAVATDEGSVVHVRLASIDGSGTIREATLTLTGDDRRLVAISYADREGNRTVFEIGEQDSIQDEGVFVPPSIEWLEN